MTYSNIQQQFNLAYNLNRENCSYNLASLCEISGEISCKILNASLDILSQRHFDKYKLKQNYHDSTFTLEKVKEIVNKPFKIEREESPRVHVWLNQNTTYLLFIFHHIIFDLRSKDIFASEFSQIYNALSEGYEPRLKPVHKYVEYIGWYNDFTHTERYKKMLAYWEGEALDNAILNLPVDKERPLVPSSRGQRIFGTIPTTLKENLDSYCRAEASDPFLVLLTAYAVFLNRFSGQEYFSIGVPRTNRPKDEFHNIIGCFVNILPLCLSVDNDISFKQLLRHVRLKMLGMHRNQNIPYLEVVKLSKGKLDAKYNPLFQVGFTFEHPMRLKLNGLEVISLDVAPDAAQLDLFFYFWTEGDHFRWAVEYCTDLFSRERVEGFIKSFMMILAQGLKDDTQLIDTMPIIDDESLARITEWNATDREYNISGGVIETFLKNADTYPENIALIFQDDSISYGELARRIRILAAFLRNKGVGPETIVGLSLERSFEMIVGMYAIVLAGGAYLPIEPTLPADYINYIREDAGLSMILSKEIYRNLFPEFYNFIALDSYDFSGVDIEADFPNINPDSRVYILYTSGSTGRPKGVEITHRGLLNRLLWMDGEYQLQRADVLFQKTPYNFDVSGWEFWWPLMKGVPLVIAEPEGHKDNSYLIETIKKEKVTIIHFVPSMLREFLNACNEGDCTSLRAVMCSGEALPAAVVRDFYETLPHAELHNLYGPTEASIDVTYWPCDPECMVVPIGKPVSNTKIHILDKALNPLPPGVTGEIYLSGVQLARGYLNKPELTDECFIANPFNGGRMYKTGDLGQWTLDGELLYIGRNDSQVQLHGLRVELGEIENCLNDHPAVEIAAVAVHGNFGADQSLIAYIVKRDELTIKDLKSFLSRRLPLHMVPQRFIFVEEILLNPNGKLDRKSLPDPETFRQIHDDKPVTIPEGESESYIADLWKEILGLDKIGRDDNFFEIGGSSIHIVRMQQKLAERLGGNIPVTDLFIHTTVRGLAAYLENVNYSDETKNKLIGRAERSRNAAQRLKNMRKR